MLFLREDSRAAKVFGVVRNSISYIIYLVVTVVILMVSLDVCLKPFSHLRRVPIYSKPEMTRQHSWIDQYNREFRESYQAQWYPYANFRRKPYKGTHINIDENGLRKTWNHTCSDESDPLRIYVLGGSTTWGCGARDDFTIPSCLSKELRKLGNCCVVVTNFGQSAYVNSQETIDLINELRKGARPDIVVFYDGINEILSACQSGIAGIPQNETNRRIEFNLSGDFDKLSKLTGQMFFKRTEIYKWLQYLTINQDQIDKTNECYPDRIGMTPEGYANLIKDMVGVYLFNIELINTLAKQYQFKPFFFWQPVVYTKNELTQSESEFKATASVWEKMQKKLYAEVRNNATLNAFSNFCNLEGVFGGWKEQAFIDFCHTTEEANVIIAKSMAEKLAFATLEICKQKNAD